MMMGKFDVVSTIESEADRKRAELARLDREIALEQGYLDQKKVRRAALAADVVTFDGEAAIVRDRAIASGETQPEMLLTDVVETSIP